MTDVVFTIGNDMRGDDGAGPLLAELLEAKPAAGWTLINGEAAPENCMHKVRSLSPSRVLIVDAADMGLAPGEVRRLEEDCIAERCLITTHTIPLNFLIASLKETVPKIIFLGVQPENIVFCSALSPNVRRSIEAIHRGLTPNADFTQYQTLD